MSMTLLAVAVSTFILNLPFGYWRANEKKLSAQWFLAIHLPVPMVVAVRIFEGLGWRPVTFVILAGAFTAGQFAGSWLHRRWQQRVRSQVTACLVWDLVRAVRMPPR